MKRVFKIDSDGFYLEPVILQDNEKTPMDCVEIEPTGSFIKGKFLDGAWVNKRIGSLVCHSIMYQVMERNR
jgi:hypothetical protein